MTRPRENRPISAFVFGFAAVSLVASVLPLLTRAGSEESLVPRAGRDASFVVYAVFLLLFVFFFLPSALMRERVRSVGSWWALALFALVFSAVPAVVAAYISGVARAQALAVGSVVATVCAGVLLLRFAFGRAATGIAFAIGGLTLFAIPAIEAVSWSVGIPAPRALAALSLGGFLRNLVIVRAPVAPLPFVAAAVVAWALVLIAAGRGARVARAATLLVLAVPAVWTQGAPPHVTVESLLGPVARAGARMPLRIVVDRAPSAVDLVFRTETFRVPADGMARTLLVTLGAGETEAEVRTAGGNGAPSRLALPVRLADPVRPIVATLAGGSVADASRAALPDAEHVVVDVAVFPPIAGALEGLDAVIVDAAHWSSLATAHRKALTDYASLSGTVVIAGAGEPESRPAQAGVVRVGAVTEVAARDLRRRLDPDPVDANLKSLFARPDWQALDLTRLIWFLVGYHGAFLLAFLLPLVLDSHKSRVVYLVSVGTVIALVVLVAWWSLKQFFLRDNQVYTQSLTFVAAGAGETPIVVRQFRSYASMSGEHRDFPWPADRDLVRYRDPAIGQCVLDVVSPSRLDDVWLDRFQAKLLVREDLTLPPALVVQREDEAFRLRPVPDVADPLGLRSATVTAAFVIEADGSTRPGRIDGARIVPAEKSDPAAVPGLDAFTRALRGKFGARLGGRMLVLRAEGVRRLDDTGGFFQVADLPSVLVFEIDAPGGR